MTKPRIAALVFIGGLIPLAFATPVLRASLGDWLAFGAALGYLLALRLIGEVVERKVKSAHDASKQGTQQPADRMRNVVAVLVVYALVLGLYVVRPDPAIKKAHLMCEAGASVAVFPDMDACATDARYKAGKCACVRPRSEWSRWYALALVPAVATVLGYLLLRGSLKTRLLLLNTAVAVALISELVRALALDPAVAMVVPLFPLLLAGFCAGITAAFLLLHVLHRFFARRANESAT